MADTFLQLSNPFRSSTRFPRSLLIAWLLLLSAVFLVYLPGLAGGFVFDDYPNIVENEGLVFEAASLEELRRISQTGTAGPLKRPVAVVSFAVNIAATGMDPWYFKLTNVFIHLLATLAFGLMAGRLLQAWEARYPASTALTTSPSNFDRHAASWAAWLAAALWALHPLQLTSVLYVVQRMTSLSALFGFLATAAYVELRYRTAFATGTAPSRLAIAGHGSAIGLWMVASVYSKENGLLFVGLIVLIEFFVFRLQVGGRDIRLAGRTLLVWGATAAVAAILAVVAWSLPRIMDTDRIPFRDFSTPERLLTQFRVLVFHLYEFFVPDIAKMSLYHDDIEISRTFLAPPSTLFSAVFLSLVTFVCAWRAKRQPVLLFAWLWFLISHSMESTIFPLELVHEHRNYFAMAGFCMALAYGAWHALKRHRVTSVWLACGALLVLGASTAARSYEWREPIVLSKMEALRHPLSMRANYQLGRDLLIAYDRSRKPELLLEAEAAFQQAANARAFSVGSYLAMLFIEYRKDEENLERISLLTREIIANFKFRPPEATYAAYVDSLLRCQIEGKCRLDDMDVLAIMTAAVDNPSVSAETKGELLKTAAQYAVNRANDWAYAQTLVEYALQYHDETTTRIVYAQILRNRDKLDLAARQVDLAEQLDTRGLYRSLIQRERAQLGVGTSERHP